jgi:FAD/FMN-containing dehydrogenase
LVSHTRLLNGARLDTATGRVTVGAGATWHDLNAATLPYGRTVPSGNASSTGVVGVALGGGVGVFTRAWGLTCDHLVRVGLVDAEGRHSDVGPDRHPDLFWLARGAGRGLGVVTELEFETRPIGREVATAQCFYPLERAREVMAAFFAAVRSSPRQVSPQLTLRRLPDAPALDAALRGRWLVAVGAAYAGPTSAAQAALEPFGRLDEPNEPVVDLSGNYPVLESAPPWSATLRAHSWGYFLDEPDEDMIATVLGAFHPGRPPGASVTLRTLGGAAAETGDEATAFAHRQARFLLTVQVEWHDPDLDEPCMRWCDDLGSAIRDGGARGVYANFCGEGPRFPALRRAAYADVARVDDILHTHDPRGVFREMAMRP